MNLDWALVGLLHFRWPFHQEAPGYTLSGNSFPVLSTPSWFPAFPHQTCQHLGCPAPNPCSWASVFFLMVNPLSPCACSWFLFLSQAHDLALSLLVSSPLSCSAILALSLTPSLSYLCVQVSPAHILWTPKAPSFPGTELDPPSTAGTSCSSLGPSPHTACPAQLGPETHPQ